MTEEIRLLARDAMTVNLAWVLAEDRPLRTAFPPNQQFAVFDKEREQFLGLVGLAEIAPHPHRIFADLIVPDKQASVADDTPIENLAEILGGEIAAVAVRDATEQVIGAVTLDSLTRRLLSWHTATRNSLIAARQEADRLTREIRELAHHQLSHIEELRREMCRELHDEFAQNCAALRWHAEIIKDYCPPSSRPSIPERADSIIAISSFIQNGLRRLIKDLRPELLDTTDLATAIEELLKDWRRANPDCHVTLTLNRNKCPVNDPLKTHLYRIVQESLNNISRHGGASQVDVSLDCGRDPITGTEAIHVRIRDNGSGYDPSATPRGLGLIGLEERVRTVDGTLTIDTAPGSGVRIEIEIPLTDT